MVRIDIPDRRHDTVVECQQTSPLRVSGLVHGVVTSNPWIAFVSSRNMFPQVDRPVLEVFVVPEGGVSGRVIAVPILVLSTGKGVKVENSVDTIFGALRFRLMLAAGAK